MLGNWFSSHNLYPATDNYWESDFFIFSDVSCSQMWFYGLSCQGTQALCTSHTTNSVAETCREQPRVLWTPRAAEVEVSEHSRTKKGQGEQQPPAGVCRLLPRDASLPTLSLNTPCQASAPGRQRRKQQTEKIRGCKICLLHLHTEAGEAPCSRCSAGPCTPCSRRGAG